ncbi:hypothetical protein I4U23_027450 [Adineta vaga]|nr:hypothetical protein I4U23_027450 [Adineta vaga]
MTHLDLQNSSVASSTTEIEVEMNEDVTSLNNISSYFSVKSTTYGGRSCFANTDLAQDTIVHECSLPLSSTITRSFKKKVCGLCFKFSDGKTLKFKLISRKNKENNSTTVSSLGLYFCSQSCMDKFIALDIDDLYLESLLNVERLFLKLLNQCQVDLENEKRQEKTETEAILKWLVFK